MKVRIAALLSLLAVGQPLPGTPNIIWGWDYVNSKPVKVRAAADGTLAGGGGGGGGATFTNDGSTTQLGRVQDTDTAAGTHYTPEAILMTPGSGGPVQTGTASSPLRVDPTGTTPQPVTGTFWQATQPVSGTFWQATQPVSGTFWQATQPVSAASLPLPAGASTEATLALLTLAQASTTSGQKGPLAQCAVTTAAPTYTTAQTDPISCTTAGAVRVDGSGTTQPVSGTVTANQGTAAAASGAWPVKLTDGTNTATVKAASTLPASTDTAAVVTQREGPRDQSKTGSITTATGTDIMTLGTGQAACSIQVTGTWTITGGAAQVLFEGSQDGGSTYAATSAWGNLTGNFFQYILSAGTGNFFMPAAGYTHLQLRASGTGFTGTLNTKWNCSTGPQPPPAAAGTYVANGGNRSQPQAVAATNGTISNATDPEGRIYVRTFGSNPFSCGLDNIAATLTQCQAAPATGFKLYVTDIVAQSTTATAGTFLVRYGTGTNCATAPTSLLPSAATVTRLAAPANTVAPLVIHLTTPLSAAAANAICVIGVATNTVTIQLSGYTAP